MRSMWLIWRRHFGAIWYVVAEACKPSGATFMSRPCLYVDFGRVSSWPTIWKSELLGYAKIWCFWVQLIVQGERTLSLDADGDLRHRVLEMARPLSRSWSLRLQPKSFPRRTISKEIGHRFLPFPAHSGVANRSLNRGQRGFAFLRHPRQDTIGIVC